MECCARGSVGMHPTSHHKPRKCMLVISLRAGAFGCSTGQAARPWLLAPGGLAGPVMGWAQQGLACCTTGSDGGDEQRRPTGSVGAVRRGWCVACRVKLGMLECTQHPIISPGNACLKLAYGLALLDAQQVMGPIHAVKRDSGPVGPWFDSSPGESSIPSRQVCLALVPSPIDSGFRQHRWNVVRGGVLECTQHPIISPGNACL